MSLLHKKISLLQKPTGFPSWSNYFSFSLAKDFVEKESLSPLSIEKNFLENIGHFVSRPVLNPINFLLREIKNPLVILFITILLIGASTLVFYPVHCMTMVITFLPFLGQIQPWMVKFFLFISLQTTILAIGVKALGRMFNKKLLDAWRSQKIIAVHIGAKKTHT